LQGRILDALLVALLQLLALTSALCRATVLIHVAMLVLVLLHLAGSGARCGSGTHATAHTATPHTGGKNGTCSPHGHGCGQKTKRSALFHDELLEVEKRESASTTPTALSARMSPATGSGAATRSSASRRRSCGRADGQPGHGCRTLHAALIARAERGLVPMRCLQGRQTRRCSSNRAVQRFARLGCCASFGLPRLISGDLACGIEQGSGA
jgi:hypothetical protein